MAEDINLANLAVTLKGDFSKFISELNNAIKGIESINAKIEKFGDKMNKTLSGDVEKPMERVKISTIAWGTMLGNALTKAGNFVIGFGKASLTMGMQYEKTMSTIKAVTGATADEMGKFGDASIKMSEGTMFSSLQAANAMEIFAKVGYKVEDIIGILPGTLDLAAAGAIDLAQAADIASSTIKTFGLNATDMTHVADVLAFAANETNTEVSELGEALKYAGPIAAQLGFSMEEVVGVLGRLSDFGIKACYDDKTEVLTDSGFKLFKNVTYSDKLATLNPITNLVEYYSPQLLMAYNHSGTLIAIRGEKLNLRVTDNHNLYVRLKGNENFGLIEAKYLQGKSFEYLYKDNGEFLIQKFNYNNSFFNAEEYSGKVYCAQVPNNLLVVRRYGVTTISGNSMAGTTLRQAMMDLFQPTKDVAILLEKYNIQVKDAAGNPLPLTNIIKQLKDANIQADESFKILGARGAGLAQIMKLPTEAFESFVDSMREGNPIIENYARTVANIRMDNLAGDWSKLIKVVQDTGLAIYSELTPALRGFAQWLKDSAIPGFVSGLQSIGKAIGEFYYSNSSIFDKVISMSPMYTIGSAIGTALYDTGEAVETVTTKILEYSKTLKYFSEASTEALGTGKTFINELGEGFTDSTAKMGEGILKVGESFEQVGYIATQTSIDVFDNAKKALNIYVTSVDKLDDAWIAVSKHAVLTEALFGENFKAANEEMKAHQDSLLKKIELYEKLRDEVDKLAAAGLKESKQYKELSREKELALKMLTVESQKYTKDNKVLLDQQAEDERKNKEELDAIREMDAENKKKRDKDTAITTAKTWGELAKALGDSYRYLDQIIGEVMDSISSQMTSTLATFFKEGGSFKDYWKQLGQDIKNDFYGILAKMLTQYILTGTLMSNANIFGIGGTGGGATGGLIGLVKGLFSGGNKTQTDSTATTEGTTSMFTTISTWFGKFFSTIGSWLTSLTSTLWGWFSSIFSVISNLISTIVGTVVNILGTVISTVSSWFSTIFSGLFNMFGNLFSALSGMFSGALSTMGGWFSSLFSNIGTWFSGMFDNIGSWFTGMFDSMGGWFKGMFSNIGEWFTGMYNNMGTYWSVLTEKMGGWWSALSKNFGGWFSAFFKETGVLFGKVTSTMGSYFSQLVAMAVAMAKSAMSGAGGFWGTVVGYASKAWDAVTGKSSSKSSSGTIDAEDLEETQGTSEEGLAEGGVVTSPMRTLIGEAGTEVALPLSRAPEILAQTLKEAGGFGQNINVNFTGTNLFTGSKNEMDRLWREGIKSAAKRDPI